MDRRSFLTSGLAAGAAFSLPGLGALTPGVYAAAARKTRRVGVIGCGWYGKCDLFRLMQVEPVEVVSLCDVDAKMLADAADRVTQKQASKARPRVYSDYRKMLAEKDLDIAIVGTPDHWHALPMIEAVKAGADVYVQKPTSVDVVESHAMLTAARKYGRVVQVGTQRRSTPHLIEAREDILKAGKLGKIAHVEICCYYHMRTRDKPVTGAKPPESLNFEMWTGPAPLLPYQPVMHPRGWRAFNEFGNGIVGDMCIHMYDTVRWMLDLGWPTRVSSAGGIYVDKASVANIADTQSATFEHDGLNVVWQHRTWGDAPDPQYPWGMTFYGENGVLKASVNSYDLQLHSGEKLHRDCVMELDKYPEDNTEPDLEKHVAPAIRGHMQNFLNAIDSRGKPVADIEQGHISTVACHLANISMVVGRTLAWDAATHGVVGDTEANSRLARPYRGEWVHPTAENV